jgi:hypothetical protein
MWQTSEVLCSVDNYQERKEGRREGEMRGNACIGFPVFDVLWIKALGREPVNATGLFSSLLSLSLSLGGVGEYTSSS